MFLGGRCAEFLLGGGQTQTLVELLVDHRHLAGVALAALDDLAVGAFRHVQRRHEIAESLG